MTGFSSASLLICLGQNLSSCLVRLTCADTPSHAPVGNAHEFDPGNPLATLRQWHLKFGSVYRSFIFALPIVQISDPKLARQIVADTETFPRGTWPWSNDNQALGGEVRVVYVMDALRMHSAAFFFLL